MKGFYTKTKKGENMQVIFIVDVFRVSEDGMAFETVAKGIEVREPVWYKESVIKAEVLKQHPKLNAKVHGRGWGVTIRKWL